MRRMAKALANGLAAVLVLPAERVRAESQRLRDTRQARRLQAADFRFSSMFCRLVPRATQLQERRPTERLRTDLCCATGSCGR
jgi:hypothetical protein